MWMEVFQVKVLDLYFFVLNGLVLKESDDLRCISEFVFIKIKSLIGYCVNNFLEYYLV